MSLTKILFEIVLPNFTPISKFILKIVIVCEIQLQTDLRETKRFRANINLTFEH